MSKIYKWFPHVTRTRFCASSYRFEHLKFVFLPSKKLVKVTECNFRNYIFRCFQYILCCFALLARTVSEIYIFQLFTFKSRNGHEVFAMMSHDGKCQNLQTSFWHLLLSFRCKLWARKYEIHREASKNTLAAAFDFWFSIGGRSNTISS